MESLFLLFWKVTSTLKHPAVNAIRPMGSRLGVLKSCIHRRSTVGAGLLAKAVGQSTSMLNVKPPSRASPLPQGICVGRTFSIHPR
ncbi:hypothetical protein E3W21_20605 [Pseudomonas sp. F01002]|nr:hypothetical protein E3W21_20605 [Pseudomonas sp. F01002]